MRSKRRLLLTHLGALAVSALGTLGVVGLSLGMNAAVQKKEGEVVTVVEAVAAAPEKRAKAAERKQRAQPVKRSSRAAPSPSPALAAGLSGLDFGLSGGADAILGAASAALMAEVGAEVMSEEQVEQAPRPIALTPPSYPSRARQTGTTGAVTVSFIVDIDGRVADVHVVDAQPPGVFEDSALEAVRRWSFEPGRNGGSPVAVRVRQTLRFELE